MKWTPLCVPGGQGRPAHRGFAREGDKIIADLRAKRDEFLDNMKKHTGRE